MADSSTNIPVFTLADLLDITSDANIVGAGTDGDADAVVVRSGWNNVAVVAVSDHPADLGDGNERAIFVSKSLHNAWRLGGATLGTASFVDGVDGIEGPDLIIPTDVTP